MLRGWFVLLVTFASNVRDPPFDIVELVLQDSWMLNLRRDQEVLPYRLVIENFVDITAVINERMFRLARHRELKLYVRSNTLLCTLL